MFDLKRFRESDREYFDVVMNMYAGLVMQVTRSFAMDEDHAEDLFQNVWIQIYEKAGSYASRGSIEAWIHRVASNVCLSEHRSRKVRKEMWQRFGADPSTWETAGTTQPDPLAHTERSERLEKFHRALAQLPDRQQQTIVLRALDGLSPAETATVMGLSTATVRSNMRHAIKRLTSIMEDPGESLSRYRSTR